MCCPGPWERRRLRVEGAWQGMLEAGLRIVTYDWVKARRTRDQDVQNLQKGGGMLELVIVGVVVSVISFVVGFVLGDGFGWNKGWNCGLEIADRWEQLYRKTARH